MTNRNSSRSRRDGARLSGVLQLAAVGAGVLALSVGSALIVRASPVGAAADMVSAQLAHPSVFAAELVGVTRQIGVMTLHRHCSVS